MQKTITIKPSLFLLILIIISMAISPAFALGEGNRNLLLIGAMAISPLVLLFSKTFNRSNIILLLFMLTIVFSPLVFHPESMRWSTVMYSWMFCLTFMAYSYLLYRKTFTLDIYLKILKYLIYAYTITLLIQQFCVLTGLPIFNLSNYDPETPWKLNSLAAEPSHSARIVALLMFCYISMKEVATGKIYNFKKNFKQDKWIWASFFWTMLTMGSGTALVFIAIILLKFVRIQSILPLILLIGIIAMVIVSIESSSFDRIYKLIVSIFTLNPEEMLHADHSGALRIVPMIIVMSMVNISSLDGWFGHGIDYTSTFLSYMIPGLPEGSSGGAMFQVWMEYGFLAFLLFVIFSFNAIYNSNSLLNILFWFLLVLLNSLNSQIVWLTIILLFTNKYFKNKITRSCS